MHGYPPISIGLAQWSEYYGGINKNKPQAYDGDYGPLIECILQGMEMGIASVRSI
ncbi:uncharacterized protein EV420DRAFT_1650176 [Desarmillaria tabescens]|uniref:Uncharacterized protein n=1 Tax=Armillaria tabescens TaxID=1929756 RepID=A0AA39MPH6_ARMTA|nr:uncharacterized protein EV420DRAFT_1650176 [Desarmillaria tabescens]KAK0441259.1 hypothetical protein EV420DRAFT_1650176 [Desarmillaria tabescens]